MARPAFDRFARASPATSPVAKTDDGTLGKCKIHFVSLLIRFSARILCLLPFAETQRETVVRKPK